MDTESNRAEIEAWLILLRAPGFGASALRDAIARHGSAQQALDAAQRGDAPVDASCREWLRKPDRARIADDIAWLGGQTHQLVTIDHVDYPALTCLAARRPIVIAGFVEPAPDVSRIQSE